MSSSSTSASSVLRNPKTFKVDLDGNIYCNHDIVAVLRVVGRKSVRNGQQFYGCSQWPGSDCKFFLWKEDVDKMLFKGQPDDYEELKVRNLELQNLLLVEENKNLRQKNSATGTKWEKLIVLILLVIIVVSLYL